MLQTKADLCEALRAGGPSRPYVVSQGMHSGLHTPLMSSEGVPGCTPPIFFYRHVLDSGTMCLQERISDFHLLLWLSKQPNLDANDLTLLCDAVRTHGPVLEGYRVIIDSIAGL